MQLHGAWREAVDEAQPARDRLADSPGHHGAGAAYYAVALAAGDGSGAVSLLRDAWMIWQELDAPYDVARVRALMGLTYRQLGDDDGAQMEFEAAGEAFDRLGAAPDAARMAGLLTPVSPQVSGSLTGREVEVLRLIATGKTNRAIAAELVIHGVGRDAARLAGAVAGRARVEQTVRRSSAA